MIENVRMQNFKCFQAEGIMFSPLTLLTGVNGTGKSTVIQTLLLLRQSFRQGFLPGRGLALNGELVDIGTARDALCDFADTEEIVLGVRYRNDEKCDVRCRYDARADVLSATVSEETEQIYAQSLFCGDFQYLGAERIGPRPSFEMNEYAVRDRHDLGRFGQYTAHFLSAFGRNPIPINQLASPDAPSNDLIDQVEYWLHHICPGVRLSVTPYRQIDAVDIRYSFVRGGDVSDSHRTTNVGFGLSYTLPVVVAALATEAGGLLVVENPESHLHPQGQVRIGELLAMAAEHGVQVILESHSDHVLNGIRLAVKRQRVSADKVGIWYFYRDEPDQFRVPRLKNPVLDQDGKIREWPDGFFDESEKSLLELL